MLDIHIERKSYGDSEPVIADLHFEVHSGEFVALLGPSGAGKSTLLQLICGLDTDYRGTVAARFQPGIAATIAVMFQDPRLMPWLTVEQNIALVVDDSEVNRRRAAQLMAAVGIFEHRYSYPAQLSGGMKKRVALARAFITDPDLLLLDEPFSSLDQPAAEELRQLTRQLCTEHGVTVLYVTHDLPEAISLADRILFLSPSPMRVVLDKAVNIKRPRRLGDAAAVVFLARLLEQYPDILKGHKLPTQAVEAG
ncbi:MAG: ABC transporter ATP-binding protein [Gammaproteobacteria bacterium]|nr:ABC transporter ATP-binding protein [Gammaproteobacteria bacterium]